MALWWLGANGEPELTPRPYDSGRDGLVIGEGEKSVQQVLNTVVSIVTGAPTELPTDANC